MHESLLIAIKVQKMQYNKSMNFIDSEEEII